MVNKCPNCDEYHTSQQCAPRAKIEEKSYAPRNPHHSAILKEIEELHEKKSHDYAEDSNVFSNFEYAEKVAAPFYGIHKVFATLVGIKLARLAELIPSDKREVNKIPNNESINDTFLDLVNYNAIWASYYRSIRIPKEATVEDPNFCFFCQKDLRNEKEFFGAGDGRGQKFACAPCYLARKPEGYSQTIAHAKSILCKRCNFVHSAHVKDTLVNRFYCPIPFDKNKYPWPTFME